MTTPAVNPQPEITDERPDEYVVESLGEGYEGWFPLGEVSLIGGSSGAGKTTWLLQVLENVRHGNDVFGHRTHRNDYCILLHDRSKRGFRRTLKRMKLPPEVQQRAHRLTKQEQATTPHEAVEEILKKSRRFQVIVIEGLDMWQNKGKQGDLVAAANFIDDLQRVAEQYNVAIIGTVGAPKMKPRDRYELQRDSLFGSSALGRKVETVVFAQLLNPKDPNSPRDVTVLVRNGRNEKFTFEFRSGLLAEVLPSELPPAPVTKTKLEEYLDKLDKGAQVTWTVETGMCKASFYRECKAAKEKGLIFKQDGSYYKA